MEAVADWVEKLSTYGTMNTLNTTKAWKLRMRIGTLCIKIMEAAHPLEEECDARHWRGIDKLLEEIETASREIKSILVHPGEHLKSLE